jgi:hypothetical protein
MPIPAIFLPHMAPIQIDVIFSVNVESSHADDDLL